MLYDIVTHNDIHVPKKRAKGREEKHCSYYGKKTDNVVLTTNCNRPVINLNGYV